MKKILSLTLCILLLALAVFPQLSASAAEEAELYRDENYIFEVVDDCEISIHHYIGSEDIVTIPSVIGILPVKSIEKWAFFDTDVKEVIIPEGITTIGEEAFYNCQSLETVTLPSTLESTGTAIFRFCQNLKTVEFSGTDSTPVLGEYLFYACNSLESVNIPSDVTSIPEGMFAYCQSLENVVLPEGTERISDYAFYGSGLSSITLPENLNYIGDMAFADCATLDEINNLSETCDIVMDNAFSGTPAGNPYEETEKITVYFANIPGWTGITISYAETANPIWRDMNMTFMETNSFGQDIYKAEIPISSTIHFSGYAENKNVLISTTMSNDIADNKAYFINDSLSLGSYNYSADINPLSPDATEPDATEPETTVPETTVPETTVPETTVPETTVPETTVPEHTEDTTESTPKDEEDNTITVYLNTNSEWKSAYIYGFYGEADDAATDEPFGTYPGIQMTLAKRTSDGVETYSAQIPADIDYIKFSDGSTANNYTDNISNGELVHNRGFRITEKGEMYWDYDIYEYAITIYFANHLSWTDLEVHYLSPDSDSVSDWRVAPMTFFETNSFGQDIYKAEIPPKLEFISLIGYSDSGDFLHTQITTPENGYGFYITQLKTGVSDYDKYKYDPNVNPLEPEIATNDEEDNTITIYFTSAEVWEDAYVYGFYGDSYETKTGEPLGTYPGIKMTYFATNPYDQKVYCAKIPSDIDYIQFSDGSSENRRTDYITSKHFTDNIIFYTYFLKGEYWDTDFFPFADNLNFFGVAPEERINIYFTNNKNWENVYIYASYNTPDTEIKTELFGTYPGMKMTCIGKNSSGDEIYCAKISISTYYIVFSDGTSGTNKTDNIITTDITYIEDKNFGFYLTDMASTHWNHERYVFGVDQDIEPTEVQPKTNLQPVGASSPDELSGIITEDGFLIGATYTEVVIHEKGKLVPISAQANAQRSANMEKANNVRLMGDSNLDNQIAINDATAIQKYVSLLPMNGSAFDSKNADVDCDREVTIKDATAIQKWLAKIETGYDIGAFIK